MLATARQRQLVGQALFVGAGLALIVIALLPLHPGAIGWPGPDWMLCLIFAWVLRRPEQAPVLVIAALALVADILLLRPIGLYAALTVIASEAARRREHRWREQGFLIEWLRVAMLMGLMVMADRVIRTLFMIPPTLAPLQPLGQDILHLIATIGAYPVAVAVLHALGLRRAAPGEMELV